MGSSGDGAEGTDTTLRYAPYLEAHHGGLLDKSNNYTATAIALGSPAADYEDVEVDVAFFGAGYALGSFPSLYDMFGKFMAGLDIDALYSQILEDTVNNPAINNLVSAESALISDDIETNTIPNIQAGMRDINSVVSSSFVMARALVEDSRTKLVAKFSAELKYKIIPTALARWSEHLKWNQNVVGVYGEILKLYVLSIMDIKELNYSMVARDRLWPIETLDYYRAAVGTLQGAMSQKFRPQEKSVWAQALGGMASGAAAGGQAGGGWGALGGGILGFASAFI